MNPTELVDSIFTKIIALIFLILGVFMLFAAWIFLPLPISMIYFAAVNLGIDKTARTMNIGILLSAVSTLWVGTFLVYSYFSLKSLLPGDYSGYDIHGLNTFMSGFFLLLSIFLLSQFILDRKKLKKVTQPF